VCSKFGAVSRSKTSSLRYFLERPSILLLAPALALLVNSPSLWGGLQIDDLYHRIKFLGPPADIPIEPATLFNLFTFNTPATNHQLADMGGFPWWTDLNSHHAFLRPMTALTHAFDHAVFPDSPVLMHVHSLLWYAGAVLAAAILFRRLMSPAAAPWAAGLAAIMYAVDDQHAISAGWIANRNAVVTACLGFVALILHDRWRRDGWKPGAIAGPMMFLIALLAGEAATAAAGYLFAYVLFIDPAKDARSRWLSLAPYAAVGFVWLVGYKALGYGASGSSLYIDPIENPLRFIRALAGAVPIFLLGQWAAPPPDITFFVLPSGMWILRALGIAVFVLMLVALAPQLRRRSDVNFWLLGMLISLIPISATAPSSRTMMYVGLGGSALVAHVIHLWISNKETSVQPAAWHRVAGALSIFFLVYHVALSPFMSAGNQLFMPGIGMVYDQISESVPDDPDFNSKDMIILSLPTPLLATYFSVDRYLDGRTYPARIRVLGLSNDALEIKRVDAKTLRLRPERGLFPPPDDPARRNVAYRVPFLDFSYAMGKFSLLTRDEDHPLKLGDRFEYTGVVFEITAMTDDGRPAEFTVTFDRPLEDPKFVWMRWDGGRLSPATIPAVGGSVTMPAERLIF
jgi:hypothetical protein